jgi:hypothetical protein
MECQPNRIKIPPRPRFFKVPFDAGGAVSVQAHAGTGRSLRSLGSPLNAQPLGPRSRMDGEE